MAGERQQGKPEGLAVKKIEQGDLIDLWKYFPNRADMLKERQWTIGTWIVTLLSGVAAFSLNQGTLSIMPLRLHLACGKPAAGLDETVGNGRLAMVEMGDDGEIADQVLGHNKTGTLPCPFRDEITSRILTDFRR